MPPSIKGIVDYIKANPFKVGAAAGVAASVYKHRHDDEDKAQAKAEERDKASKEAAARAKKASQYDADALAADYQTKLAALKKKVLDAEQALEDAHNELDEVADEAKKAGVKVGK